MIQPSGSPPHACCKSLLSHTPSHAGHLLCHGVPRCIHGAVKFRMHGPTGGGGTVGCLSELSSCDDPDSAPLSQRPLTSLGTSGTAGGLGASVWAAHPCPPCCAACVLAHRDVLGGHPCSHIAVPQGRQGGLAQVCPSCPSYHQHPSETQVVGGWTCRVPRWAGLSCGQALCARGLSPALSLPNWSLWSQTPAEDALEMSPVGRGQERVCSAPLRAAPQPLPFLSQGL